MAALTLSQRPRHPAQGAQCIGPSGAGDHNIVRPAALDGVGHLALGDCPKLGLGHARTGQHPHPLQQGRGCDDDDRVDAHLGAGLKQECDVEHHQACALPGVAAHERMLRSAHQRVENTLELGQPGRIGENEVAQRAPIHRAAARGLGKRRRHGHRGRPAGRQ